MKTILVIYTAKKLTDLKEIGKLKRYCFNTSSTVKEGDMIQTKAYDTPMQVVSVLDQSYMFYNSVTGELSNQMTSTQQWKVRTLEIREETADETIIGQLI